MDGRCCVLLLGEVGSGKSTFAQLVTQDPSIKISHSLGSGTSHITLYETKLENWTCVIVDTPGLNNDHTPDRETFRRVSTWLKSPDHAACDVTATLYFHRITEPRFQGSSHRNLLMFSDLYKGSLQNLFLATSFWGYLSKTTDGQQMGERREAELVNADSFWGSMVRQGARVLRIPETGTESRSMLLDIIARLPVKHVSLGNHRSSCSKSESGNTILGRSLAVDDLERVRTEHEKQKQEVAEQYRQFIAEDLERRRTLEEEQRQQCENLILARQEEERAFYEMQRKETEYAKAQCAEIDRRQSEQLENLERSLTSMNSQHQYQQYQNRWQCWQRHCVRMNRELAMLQNARNANRTLSKFFPRIDTICCNNCFLIVKQNEEYFMCRQCWGGQFFLCTRCMHVRKAYCDNAQHVLYRHTQVRYQGACLHRVEDIAPNVPVSCGQCGRGLGTVYLHCCSCDSGYFYMCLECAVAGAICNKFMSRKGHPLHIYTRYVHL
ncbi:hypothetical protein BGZ57DRAFT_130769 [Hyaloscypha finlandica]|nr:hypothetical protein BGZ57DRAFT_130769 [Hyaloscypha finlandica]